MRKFKLILSIVVSSVLFISCAEQKEKEEVKDSDNVLLQVDQDPTVSFNIWFKTGSVNDPEGKEGLTYITAQMMADASTENIEYSDILDKLYPMAASYGAKVDKEMTTFRGRVHKDNLEEYKQLFLDAILKPAFKEDDFNRIKNNTINYIENELRYSSDEELGKFSLYNFVFKGTPYGHMMNGSVQGLKNITLDDVKEFHKSHFNKNNFVIGLGGGFDDKLVETVESNLNNLQDTTIDTKVEVNPEPINGQEVLLVEKDNNSTAISFGFPIDVVRGDEDFYPLALFNSWFGEHRNQSSHLFQVIRGERGMNYGDYSYIERFLNGGVLNSPNPNNARNHQLFEVWIRPVEHKNRHFALRAAMRELKKVVDNGLTEEQFETTKRFLYKYVLHRAPNTQTRLGYQIDSKFYGVEDDGNYIQHFREKINNLTLEEVNAAIKKHIQYDNVKIAMVTDNAEEFKEALVNNTPSPIEYDSEKPEEILEEDKEISTFELNIKPEKVKIVPVDTMFEGGE